MPLPAPDQISTAACSEVVAGNGILLEKQEYSPPALIADRFMALSLTALSSTSRSQPCGTPPAFAVTVTSFVPF